MGNRTLKDFLTLVLILSFVYIGFGYYVSQCLLEFEQIRSKDKVILLKYFSTLCGTRNRMKGALVLIHERLEFLLVSHFVKHLL